jgi:uncharacterized protein (DUF433 family)
LARYRSGLANIYLEDFITWLESQGYRRFMIRRHVRGVVHFTETFDLSHVSADPSCRGDLLQPPVVRPIAHSIVLILVPPNKNGYAPTMLDWNQCPTVERVPGKVSGVWLFKGTRVPVKALFENLEDSAGVDDFLRWFPGVKRDQVLAVLEFAEQSLTVA